MKQILQNLQSGKTELVDGPWPGATGGQIFIKTSVSLISAGTERMLFEADNENLICRAKRSTEKVLVK
jgi:hypothetical protein